MPREKITKENVSLKDTYKVKFCKKGKTLMMTVPRDIVVYHELKPKMEFVITPTKDGKLILHLYGFVEKEEKITEEDVRRAVESWIPS